jgi:hypothetical protein
LPSRRAERSTCHRRLLELERERARVDLRELEEIVHEPPQRANLVAHGREVMLGGDDPVLDRLEHRLQRGERGLQVVARPRDQLSSCVEELLELSRHLVEGEADLDELVGPRAGRHRRKIAARERRRGGTEAVERNRDRAGDEQGGAYGDERGRTRDGQDDDVGSHVEHRHARQENGRERKHDAKEREPEQAGMDGTQPRDAEGDERAQGERRRGDDEGELDHGENL